MFSPLVAKFTKFHANAAISNSGVEPHLGEDKGIRCVVRSSLRDLFSSKRPAGGMEAQVCVG